MNHPSPRASRRGITLFELLAAFSILSVVIPVSAGLLVRNGRLLVSARNQRIAIDELTNQLERLRSLAVPEPGAFVAGPEPSAFAAAHLPGVTLALTADPPGSGPERRVELAIEWNEPVRRGHPLRLVGWIPARATSVRAGEGSP